MPEWFLQGLKFPPVTLKEGIVSSRASSLGTHSVVWTLPSWRVIRWCGRERCRNSWLHELFLKLESHLQFACFLIFGLHVFALWFCLGFWLSLAREKWPSMCILVPEAERITYFWDSERRKYHFPWFWYRERWNGPTRDEVTPSSWVGIRKWGW